MTTSIADILTDSGTGKWCKVLKGSRIGSGSCYDNGIRHSTLLTQCLHERSYGRTLLTDGYIDTIDRITLLIVLLLVDDGVDSDGGLTGLTVTDDELTLATADRDHSIDSLQTCLERTLYRLAENYARSLTLKRHLELLAFDLSHTIEWLTQWVDDTAEHVLIDLNRGNALGALYYHALLDLLSTAEEHSTHIVFLQVHDDGHDTILEFQQLVHLGIAQTIDTSHTVTDSQHRSDLVEMCRVVDAMQLLQQHLADFAGFDITHCINKFISY